EAEAVAAKHLRCVVRQPVGADWASHPGCLPGQEGWREYLSLWGVMAADEEEAARLASKIQSECHELPATVEQVEDLGESYVDKRGVLWQGQRWCRADSAKTG